MSTQACYYSNAPTPLVTTAETAVLTFTIPPMEETGPLAQGVYIDANVVFTSGTAATNAIARVRQGSGVTGPQIGQPSAVGVVTAGGANQLASVTVLDQTPGYPQGQTYTVTLQQVTASGNGVVQQVTASVAPVVNSFSG